MSSVIFVVMLDRTNNISKFITKDDNLVKY
jgi:hypothetical protein